MLNNKVLLNACIVCVVCLFVDTILEAGSDTVYKKKKVLFNLHRLWFYVRDIGKVVCAHMCPFNKKKNNLTIAKVSIKPFSLSIT